MAKVFETEDFGRVQSEGAPQKSTVLESFQKLAHRIQGRKSFRKKLRNY